MKIPLGIEGDYIESKENSLFFDVKGLLHPKDRKICFLRFYPDDNGTRVKGGVKYKKIYDLKQRYELVKVNYPQHLFFSPEYDMELQCVKNEDIKKIYSPRNYLNQLFSKQKLSDIEKISKELSEIFIYQGRIPKDQIGVTGSPMIKLDSLSSDIDIIIYGTRISHEFQKNLKQLFHTTNQIRMYSPKEYKKHYKWRVGGSDITFNEFMQSEKRKLHQGKFCGIDFFIRYIKTPADWPGTYYDYKFNAKGRVSIIAEIIEDKDAIFTPCSYKIKTLKIIKSDKKIKQTISEVSSFRGRYCEQARKGEKVRIEGKLEKVKFKDIVYFRVLLTDQRLDKMIVLN